MTALRLLPLLVLVASAGSAEVVRVEIDSVDTIAGGKPFGHAGAFEAISGTLHYAVDPERDDNVHDIEFAPTNAAGRVEFSADFYLIRPADVEAGNGTLFFEVVNRGRKGALTRFNRAEGSSAPLTDREIGNGFLLSRGYSILWVGWQHDTPQTPGLMRVDVPIASDDGSPIEGIVRSDIFVEAREYSRSLGDRGHVAYAVADPDDPRNVMTVREGMFGERHIIPRDQWRFARFEAGSAIADTTSAYLESGFEPGKIYEVVFVAENPPVAGLGLAAIRDAISLLKYEGSDELGVPQGALDRAIAYGSSQSGRLLRTFLYDGFNEDENGRIVFDGLMPHIAGAARGSFNQRFAQASRAPGGAWEYPNLVFPFSDATQTDPASGRQDGLLADIPAHVMPKIFYTNSSTEYWRSSSALTHTSVDGKQDLELLPNVRSYHLTGTQHGPARFPPADTAAPYFANPNDYVWHLRGLLVALDRWITDDIEPPASRYSTLSAATLVEFDELGFPKIPGVDLLPGVSIAYAMDHGPDLLTKGIITQEPPKLGHAYPFLVPRVDSYGNEIDGLRSPELIAPLATYTGWLPTNPVSGVGMYIPFPRTDAERSATGDPRYSIEDLYGNRDRYLGRVEDAARDQIEAGYLLEEDLTGILEQAGSRWDFVMSEH
ncbi:MAG TPA: alpha/beta hydrolase domain-containing protein [Gammaproteobacteria bacterium]